MVTVSDVVDGIEYDYPEIEYPILFSDLYTKKSLRYNDISRSSVPEFICLENVSSLAFQDCDYIIVTGCSDNHFFTTINLLYSIVYQNCFTSFVLVDYGISDGHLPLLWNELDRIHQLHVYLNSTAVIYYRRFNFQHFPLWWDITNQTIHGGYSWKIVSIVDVLMESKHLTIWADGGDLLPQSISSDIYRAKQFGFYSPSSGGSVQQWTHYGTFQYLKSHYSISHIRKGKDMCNGAYMLFDYFNTTTMKSLVIPYLECAYTRKCISPYGSSRKNHRQDQSVISILVHRTWIPQSCDGSFGTSVLFHRDCKGIQCYQIRKMLFSQILSKYRIERRFFTLPHSSLCFYTSFI